MASRWFHLGQLIFPKAFHKPSENWISTLFLKKIEHYLPSEQLLSRPHLTYFCLNSLLLQLVLITFLKFFVFCCNCNLLFFSVLLIHLFHFALGSCWKARFKNTNNTHNLKNQSRRWNIQPVLLLYLPSFVFVRINVAQIRLLLFFFFLVCLLAFVVYSPAQARKLKWSQWLGRGQGEQGRKLPFSFCAAV